MAAEETDAVTVQPGTTSRRPGVSLSLESERERLAKCVFSSGSALADGDVCVTLDPGGANLSVLNSGYAPLLAEHFRSLDHLLGTVIESWRTDDAFAAVVKFARRPQCDEIFNLLLDGHPIGCSQRYTLVEVEERPPLLNGTVRHFRVLRWKPTEISIVCQGADEGALVCAMPDYFELAAEVDKRRAARLEAERAERVASLKGDAWRGWALDGAATNLAERLGIAVEFVRPVLLSEVEQHLAQLEQQM
jgi:hypothetical protein